MNMEQVKYSRSVLNTLKGPDVNVCRDNMRPFYILIP